jgi:hypothetical protein
MHFDKEGFKELLSAVADGDVFKLPFKNEEELRAFLVHFADSNDLQKFAPSHQDFHWVASEDVKLRIEKEMHMIMKSANISDQDVVWSDMHFNYNERNKVKLTLKCEATLTLGVSVCKSVKIEREVYQLLDGELFGFVKESKERYRTEWTYSGNPVQIVIELEPVVSTYLTFIG